MEEVAIQVDVPRARRQGEGGVSVHVDLVEASLALLDCHEPVDDVPVVVLDGHVHRGVAEMVRCANDR